MTAAHEHQRGGAVHEHAERRDPDDGTFSHFGGCADPIDGFDGDGADREQQKPGVGKGSQDRGPPVAVGVLLGRLPACQPSCGPCQQQRDHVGKIVNRVRNQRQRVGGIAETEFRRDESDVESNTDGECDAEMVGRVAVPGMGMVVGVIVVVMGHFA